LPSLGGLAWQDAAASPSFVSPHSKGRISDALFVCSAKHRPDLGRGFASKADALLHASLLCRREGVVVLMVGYRPGDEELCAIVGLFPAPIRTVS
jgi:hypothetical protein